MLFLFNDSMRNANLINMLLLLDKCHRNRRIKKTRKNYSVKQNIH